MTWLVAKHQRRMHIGDVPAGTAVFRLRRMPRRSDPRIGRTIEAGGRRSSSTDAANPAGPSTLKAERQLSVCEECRVEVRNGSTVHIHGSQEQSLDQVSAEMAASSARALLGDRSGALRGTRREALRKSPLGQSCRSDAVPDRPQPV